MYKRPAIREKLPSVHSRKCDIKPGTLLHTITHPPPTKHFTYVVRAIYRKEDYIRLYTTHREELGLEPKELNIPDYVPPTRKEKTVECLVTYINPVHLQLKILKSGIIRIKLNTAIGDLHDQYYSKQKSPPLKALVQAYKSVGYSNTFLEKIIKSHDKRIKITESFNMDKAFGKEPVKKTKKKKEEPEPDVEIEDDDDEEEEDDPGEDGEMDVECDDEDELVDQNVEEFIDDDE
jgi:hypothetical protein